MRSFLVKVSTKALQYFLAILRFFLYIVLMLRFMFQKRIVPMTEDPLLLMSATKLAEQIRQGKVLSETVILAYINRIREVQPYINAVVEDRFSEAIEEARQVDSFIALNSKTKEEIAAEKPLLGVPITVKLMIAVKGMYANGASKYFKHRKATEDHESVALLKNAGAIVIATTNMSEFALHIYSSNSLYGRTNNPYDTTKSVGGSSGGEAALVAAAGSVLGLGNDMGGSIRIPASFCGVFGHKPSAGIASEVDGLFPKPSPGFKQFVCMGPICRYAEDILTTVKIFAGPKRAAELKLDEPVDIKNLKVYYMQSDGECELVPRVDNDVLLYQLKAMIHFEEKLGAQTDNLELEEMKYIFFYCLGKFFLTHGEKHLRKLAFGEENAVNYFAELLKHSFGASKLDFYTLFFGALDSTVLDKALRAKPQIEERFTVLEEKLSSLMDDRTILLVPAFPYKATYHGEELLLMHCAGFCSVFNVLGMPATFCPLSCEDDGRPFGIQIVASKNNDRLAIACAIELERVFGGWRQAGTTI